MKQYLMMSAAAITLLMATSCSRETDLYDPTAAGRLLQETYANSFKENVGTPNAEQTWGFGESVAAARTRSGNMEDVDSVAQTSTGINANANEWADKADAPHGHGGWVVPDPLTAEQKAIVAQYFQTHDKLTYDDPQWTNFFVQQVYKGDSIVKHGDTTEGIVAANGSKYASGTMNLLTVGHNHQHINNFNGGNASTVSVLDNGYTVNDFANNNHPDQIMLMVNIDDTGCMGYFSSGASVHRDDKAALVDWQTIADWANSIGLNGNCLNDGWNRSFVGFDLALKNLDESTVKDDNGNTVNAKFTDGQNSGLQYVWDGNEVLKRGAAPATGNLEAQDRTADLANAGMWDNSESLVEDNGVWTYTANASWHGFGVYFNEDWTGYNKFVVELEEAVTAAGKVYVKSNYSDINGEFAAGDTKVEVNGEFATVTEFGLALYSAGTIKIKKITLVAGGDAQPLNRYESDYLLVNGKEVPFLSTNTNMYAGEYKTISDNDMKISKDGKDCFNMAKIAELVNDGYLPVKDKNLREWVKFQYGDGYFSDWIVSLNKAKRQSEDGDENPVVAQGRIMCEDLGTIGDFDFNDVVFDAFIHKDGTTEIKLLAAGGTLHLTVAGEEVHSKFGVAQNQMVNTGLYSHDPVTFTAAEKYTRLIDIPIIVRKQEGSNITNYNLTAEKGEAPQKICVPVGTQWCDEYVSITKAYPGFKSWVEGENGINWSWLNTRVDVLTDLELDNNK